MIRKRMIGIGAAAVLLAACSGEEVAEKAAEAAGEVQKGAEAVRQAVTLPEPTSTAPAETDTSTELDLSKVREVAEIAVEIEKDPTRVIEILSDHGISAEQLESMLYDIAEEPDLAKTFKEAKRLAQSR